MQHQNIDQSKVLKREDEMTDISKMPLSQVKPQEARLEQPASQRSTMQSVSMGEVPATGNEETILGSVASIHDQMQPGSFMSPISDRKSGSLENLSAEEKSTSTGPSAMDNFAHKAVEKIEEFVHAAQGFAHVAADKIAEFAKDLTSEQSKAQFASETESLKKSAQAGAEELKQNITKKAYLVRKSVTRKLGKRGERLEKKAGLAAGIAKVYAKEEMKDLKRKTRRYARNVDLSAGATKATLKKEEKTFEAKARKFQRDFEREAAFAGEALRQGAFELRQKARQMYNDFPRNARLARDSLLSEIKYELASDYKPELDSDHKPETMTEVPAPSGSQGASGKFLLQFSASEWNGRQGKSRPQGFRRGYAQGQRRPAENFESNLSKWFAEISAHEWNMSSPKAAAQQASFLMSKAQDYLRRASRQYDAAEKRFFSTPTMKSAGRFYKQALGKTEEIGTMIRGQVNELVDEATKRFSDASLQNRSGNGQELKEKSQNFVDRATQKGQEFLEDLDETKEAARRKLIEKKAEMQFKAELLTQDKFPSQEALSKKQAINSEIRSLRGKENTSQ